MRILVVAALVLMGCAVASSVYLSRPLFEDTWVDPPRRSLAVAPQDMALTFARSLDGAVLLVASANAEGVSVIDVNRMLATNYPDPVALYQALGYDRLRTLLANAHMMQRLPWSSLGVPLATGAAHIAAGTNYRAHAEEVGHEGQPFLFPKLSSPVRWNSPVAAGNRLDYEVELCAVPLHDYIEGDVPPMGYLLCNDFTDRWLLVRDIDLDGPMGISGFALAKGGETRLPVGPLLLVPRVADMYQSLELNLYVDARLRQQTSAQEMIWQPEDILQRALQNCRTPYALEDKSVRLTACDRVAAGTLLLTGTPAGVMFKIANIWAPWAYLRPGKRVHSYGTYLGSLDNTVLAQ